MASTVKRELDKANPNNLPDLLRLAKAGKGLAIAARTERVAVASHLAELSQPAKAIVSCFAVAGTSTGYKTPVATESTPGAGEVAINELGNAEFAAADAVTDCEITYIPIEEDLFTEVIPVTAGGVGTFVDSKSCAQIVSATLNAPAATPGAKTIVARGTAVPGAGQAAVALDGTNIQFVAAEAGVACTANVTYHAFPSIGDGAETSLGDRLDADYYL